MSTLRTTSLQRLAGLVLLAGLGTAQAASLALTSGSVGGSLSAAASVNGQADAISGSLLDLTGIDVVQGFGGGDSSLALAPAGSLNHLWSASASLDLSAPVARFEAASSSARTVVAADGSFGGDVQSLSLLLEAALTITSTGEAAGTPVRLDLSGTAESLFSSSGPVLDVLPSFDLVLRDAQSVILGSWQGLAPGGTASFALSVVSRVGDTLQFSLSHASTLLADAAVLNAATGLGLDATAVLTGSLSVTAVPEPESCALLLAGLAALGLLQARRRRAH